MPYFAVFSARKSAFFFRFCVILQYITARCRILLYFLLHRWYNVRAMLKERLRLWLAETKTSRAELAEKLGVKLRTVEGWLGKKGRPIPLTKTELIEKLIKPTNAPGCIAVSVSFTPEQWEELTKDMPEGADKQKLLVERLLAFTRAARLPGE